jgi:hypothetical protein
MAPNLAVLTHELIQNVVNSKLQGDQGPKLVESSMVDGQKPELAPASFSGFG